MKGLYRKISALLLVAMLFSMLGPVGVFASDVGAQPVEPVSQVAEVDETTKVDATTGAPADTPAAPAEGDTTTPDATPNQDEQKTDDKQTKTQVEDQNTDQTDVQNPEDKKTEDKNEQDPKTDAEKKDEEKAENTQLGEEKPQELSFYEQLMKLKTCKEIYEILNAEGNEDKVLALTKDQLNSLKAYIESLNADETKEELLLEIDFLITGENEVETLGLGGHGFSWGWPDWFPGDGDGDDDDDEHEQQDTLYTHTFGHVDIRIAGASLALTTKLVDVETGEPISSSTKTITAYVTAVHSATINGTTYTGFSKSGNYEYRHMNTSIKVTDSSTASFVVDLQDSQGNKYPNVTVSYGVDGIKAAATNCDGYHNWNGKPSYDGLDFYISGTSTTVTYTTISFPVTKEWNDQNDKDGLRPSSITVVLYKNNNSTGKTLVLNAANNWSGSFNNLTSGSENYSVKEKNVPTGYIVNYENNGRKITNTHTPNTVTVSGTKTWNDNNNEANKRPTSITVKLLANGTEKESKIITPDTNGAWTYEFTNLPEYQNGKKIAYTVQEVDVNDYTASYVKTTNGYDIKNTYTPGKRNIPVTKIWRDADNQDGKRPASITVKLLAGGVDTGKTLTLNAANGWSSEFKDLSIANSDGSTINYTVQELPINAYTSSIDGNMANGFTITNTHEPEEIAEIAVTKAWEDENDQDGYRPTSVTVKLYANNVDTGKSVTLNESNSWKGSFTNLPFYENGIEIAYTVKENAVTEYTAKVTGNVESGFVVKNTHTPDVYESVKVTKSWVDNNNADGERPNQVVVTLYEDGMPTDKTVTLNEGNNWSASFENLPVYKAGKIHQEIVYTVKENAVDGYRSYVGGNVHEGFTVTNWLLTDVSGTKTWNDQNDQDGKRPEEITVKLLVNGEEIDWTSVEADANGVWKYEFTNLPKYYSDNTEIQYAVDEVEVADGYTAKVEGYNIINTHTPETTSVSGTKHWEDNNDQDGKRPESITVVLYADSVEKARKTVTAENDWSYEFVGLPVYKDHGIEINYSVAEVSVPDYSTELDGNDIYNRYTPSQTSVAVMKKWDDNNNQDGIRPDSVTVRLLADGKETQQSATLSAENNWSATFTELDEYRDGGTKIVYTVVEDDVEGYTASVKQDENGVLVVTNTHEAEKLEGSISGTKTWNDNNDQDGIRPESITVNLLANGKKVATQTVTAENGWKYEFKNLDKYYDGGKEIKYTVEEMAVAGYTSKLDGYNITNTHEPEKLEGGVSGEKIWKDNDDQDGLRPDSITVNLLANGEKIASKTVTENDGWKYTFTNLDKYADGEEIVYTVSEEAVKGYTAKVDGYNITNTHEAEKLEGGVSGEKIWKDNDDQDGLRPDGITVNLLADGKKIASKTVTAKDGWKYQFEDLDKYADGKEIVYTVTEDAVKGYTTKVDGYNITNTHEIETTDLTVEKKWVDNSDKADKRPEDITVQLYANGEKYGDAVKLTAKDGWKYTFKDLPVYQDGKKIEYSVKETSVKYYVAKYTAKDDVLTITNTFVDIPLTGDTINLLFWTMMVLGAGAVLGGITFRRIRRKA